MEVAGIEVQYKPQCHHEIFCVDEEMRSAFCCEIQQRASDDHHSLSSICFIDACTFSLNNDPKLHNTRNLATFHSSIRTRHP